MKFLGFWLVVLFGFGIGSAFAQTRSGNLAPPGQKVVHFDLSSGQAGIYGKTVFVGFGVDALKKDPSESDEMGQAVSDLLELLAARCSQGMGAPSRLYIGSEATADRVVKKLEALIQSGQIKRNDRVIIDVCAHGSSGDKAEFLLASATKGGAPSRLSMAKLRRLFEKIPSENKVLIADGCETQALLVGTGRWDAPRIWRQSLGRSCSVVLVSQPVVGQPQLNYSGTEFHQNLISAIIAGTHPRYTTTLSTVLASISCRKGAIETSDGDIILAGDNSVQGQDTVEHGDEELLAENWQRHVDEVKDNDKREQAQAVQFAHAALADLYWAALRVPFSEDKKNLSLLRSRYEVARKVYTLELNPQAYGDLQRYFGIILSGVGELGQGTDLFEEAIAVQKLGIQGTSREKEPAAWAGSMIDIGVAQSTLATRTGKAEAFKAAVGTFRDALGAIDGKQHPRLRSFALNNLGGTLRSWAVTSGKIALVEESKAVLEEALTLLDAKEKNDRAYVEGNLGETLTLLGEVYGTPETLRQAENAFQEATKNLDPRLTVKNTQIQMGYGLLCLGLAQRNSDPEKAKQALQSLQSAIKHLKHGEQAWCRVINQMGIAHALLSHIEKDPDEARKAIAALDELIATMKPDTPDWKDAVSNRAVSVFQLGVLTKEPKLIKEDIDVQQKLVDGYDEVKQAADWSTAMHNLGLGYKELGILTHDSSDYDNAIRCFKRALKHRTLDEQPQLFAYTWVEIDVICRLKGDVAGRIEALKHARDGYRKIKDLKQVENCDRALARLGDPVRVDAK